MPEAVPDWSLGGSETYAGVQRWTSRSSKPDVLNGSSITEFGLRSGGDASHDSGVLNSPRLVAELALLLAFCWEAQVASVYYESLGDHPRKHGEYMGLFDKWGGAKRSYSYLRLVQTVISTGYSVQNSSQLLEIVGRQSNRSLLLAHVDIDMVLGQNSTVVAASADFNGTMLRRGEWL
eukprot:COSAG05_NODE_9251_length_636_cov_1.018622_1_plen_177_part_10